MIYNIHCSDITWASRRLKSPTSWLLVLLLANENITSPHHTNPLQWRHNEGDDVSNHQPQDYLLNRLFGCRSKKTSKLRVIGLCAGKSPGTCEFLAQMTSNAANVSFWWRHHATFWERNAPVTDGYPYKWLLTLKVFPCYDDIKYPIKCIHGFVVFWFIVIILAFLSWLDDIFTIFFRVTSLIMNTQSTDPNKDHEVSAN